MPKEPHLGIDYIQISDIQTQRENLERSQRWRKLPHPIYRGTTIRILLNFSSETMQARIVGCL